jgi:hypothetical protein
MRDMLTLIKRLHDTAIFFSCPPSDGDSEREKEGLKIVLDGSGRKRMDPAAG